MPITSGRQYRAKKQHLQIIDQQREDLHVRKRAEVAKFESMDAMLLEQSSMLAREIEEWERSAKKKQASPRSRKAPASHERDGNPSVELGEL